MAKFRRLTTPPSAANYVTPGGESWPFTDYEYINKDPAAVDRAPMDTNSGGSQLNNPGSFFVAFQDDASSAFANRPHWALSENTDILDEMLHRPIVTVTRTTVPEEFWETNYLDITSGYVWTGTGASAASLVKVLYDGYTEYRSIYVTDDISTPLSLSTMTCTAITQDGASVLGTGFVLASSEHPVRFTFSNDFYPDYSPYVWYGTRGSWATASADVLLNVQMNPGRAMDALGHLVGDLRSSSGGRYVGLFSITKTKFTWASATLSSRFSTLATLINDRCGFIDTTNTWTQTNTFGGAVVCNNYATFNDYAQFNSYTTYAADTGSEYVRYAGVSYSSGVSQYRHFYIGSGAATQFHTTANARYDSGSNQWITDNSSTSASSVYQSGSTYDVRFSPNNTNWAEGTWATVLSVQGSSIKSYTQIESVVDETGDRGTPRFFVNNSRDSDDLQLISKYVTNLTSRASNHGNVYSYTKPGPKHLLAFNAYWDFGAAGWVTDKDDPDTGNNPVLLLTQHSRYGIVRQFARDTDSGSFTLVDNGHAAVMAKKSVSVGSIDDLVFTYNDTNVLIDPFLVNFKYVVTETSGAGVAWKCHAKFNCSYCTVSAPAAVTYVAFAIAYRSKTFTGSWTSWSVIPGSKRVIPAALIHSTTFQIPELSASRTIPDNGTTAQEVEFSVIMESISTGSGTVTISWPDSGDGYFEVEVNAYAGVNAVP